MQQLCPHNQTSVLTPTEQARRATLSKAELRRSKGDQALTQIIVFRGVVAFRKGGWEDGNSTARNVVFEKEEFAEEGYRERLLTKAWVYCRWGRGMAKGMDEEMGRKVHGDAWREGGFVEFTGLEGVWDWLGEEAQEMKKGRGEDEE